MSKIQALEVDKQNIPRVHKINLSVYQYPYTWKSWSGFWGNIKTWFDNRRAAKQRAKMGYSYRDIWDCGDYIVDLIIVMLIEYRNKTNGYPGTEEFPTFESWIAYLDEIINLLDYSRQDPDELSDYHKIYNDFVYKPKNEWTDEENEVFDLYIEEVQVICKKQKEACIKAFSILAPYIKHIYGGDLEKDFLLFFYFKI